MRRIRCVKLDFPIKGIFILGNTDNGSMEDEEGKLKSYK
jgi:hypothetical protein